MDPLTIMIEAILASSKVKEANRFLEDGVAADQCRRQSYNTDAMEWFPQMKPDRRRRQCHKQNTEHLDELEGVLVAVFMIVAFVVLLWKVV